MPTSHYHRRHLARFGTIARGQPDLADAFFAYYGAVFQPAALSAREKSLAALAVAHVVQCPYCIDAYTRGSLEAGADLSQMTEAVHAASAVRGESVLAYGVQMSGQAGWLSMDGPTATVSQEYFDRNHSKERSSLAEPAPGLADAQRAWKEAVFTDGALASREKHLIALACAHAIQCPYQIEAHTLAAKKSGAELPELTEAAHVACAIRGGAALVHGIQMMEQIEEEETER